MLYLEILSGLGILLLAAVCLLKGYYMICEGWNRRDIKIKRRK